VTARHGCSSRTGLVLEDWSASGLTECPNARQDALIDELFQRTERHAAWRGLDPRSPEQMPAVAAELGLESASKSAATNRPRGSQSCSAPTKD
jgi:hypothetical protein